MNSEFQAGGMVSVPDRSVHHLPHSSNVGEYGPDTLGDAAGGFQPLQPPAATLFVYRDDDDMLHWKAAAKGARWHNSKSQSLGEVCRQADEVMPTERYEIDYVEVRS